MSPATSYKAPPYQVFHWNLRRLCSELLCGSLFPLLIGDHPFGLIAVDVIAGFLILGRGFLLRLGLFPFPVGKPDAEIIKVRVSARLIAFGFFFLFGFHTVFPLLTSLDYLVTDNERVTRQSVMVIRSRISTSSNDIIAHLQRELRFTAVPVVRALRAMSLLVQCAFQ